MSIAISKKYFDLERERVKMATNDDLRRLKKTYSSKLAIPDFNNPKFWDGKFADDCDVETNNPMEVDRNITASKWIRSIISKVNNCETLNVGCGDGNFEALIYNQNLLFNHTGIDMAKATISRLKKKFPKFSFKVKNVIQDGIGLKKYDVITLFEVLEHIPPRNTLPLLSKINTAIRNDGYFMISVPMNEGLEEMFPDNPNGHLRCYSKELIFAELKMSGFEILKFELFFAFSSGYALKKIVAKYVLQERWKPNNILILCRKLAT